MATRPRPAASASPASTPTASASRVTGSTHDAPIPRAPRTLIYVPGLGRSALNSAEVICESLVAMTNPHVGSVKAAHDVAAAPPGLNAIRSIHVENERVLDVLELDFRPQLERMGQADDGKETSGLTLAQTGLYTFSTLGYVIKALGRRQKSPAAKFQLVIGAVECAVLALAFFFTAAAAFVALLAQAGITDSIVPQDARMVIARVAVAMSVVLGASYAWIRAPIIRASRGIQQLVTYLTDEYRAQTISSSVTRAIDSLLDDGYDGEIHLLGYSFGSVVLLDDLAPRSWDDGQEQAAGDSNLDRTARRVSSLVTVACPYDFVCLYLPKYFEDRRSRRSDLPWRNIFVASDVFASNFIHEPDPVPGAGRADRHRAKVELDTRSGQGRGPAGMMVHSERYLPSESLTFWSVVRQMGLRRHSSYWSPTTGCWSQRTLRQWGLLPAEATDERATTAGTREVG